MLLLQREPIKLLRYNCGHFSNGFVLNLMYTLYMQVTKGKNTLSFYTLPEYEDWKENNNPAGWSVKYYKGLGTSTEKEAKEYFAAIDDHRKQFVWKGKGLPTLPLS